MTDETDDLRILLENEVDDESKEDDERNGGGDVDLGVSSRVIRISNSEGVPR